MNSLILSAYCAFHLLAFGMSLSFIHERRRPRCRPASDETLKLKLQSIGGFNEDIVAFDRHSAKKNLEKVVIQSKGTFKSAKELERTGDMSDTLRSDDRFCMEKGSRTKDGNLNLCRKCFITFDLGKNRFPRYVTQTKCQPDWKALGNEGECIERYMPMKFLKKSPTCVVSNGKLSEKWESHTEKVSIGCECEIVQESFLKRLVKR